jgi:hydroxyacylglutathione hydrolase
MKVEQLYTGCLAHGAYYITSNGEAAIIDPLRDIQPYIDRLKNDNVKLRYIFETHFHADFVSGHIDLSKATGAKIVYGPTAKGEFEMTAAEDGQIFPLGDVKFKVLHTPGHTLESATFLLYDEKGKEHAIFSGDTLFLGDVGRPDLAQKAANMTQEELAGLLYESLTTKIIPLPDDVIVYPGHGAGSACGKNMMKETVDTLGHQKKVNYALNQPDKKAFVKAVTDGLTPPPGYFGMNVSMNKKGSAPIDEVYKQSMRALSPAQFREAAEATEAVILDTRSAAEFYKGFIPRSINIGLSGDFAPWVGALIVDVNQPILLVTAPGEELQAITRLSRVGFDNVVGYLDGGFAAWQSAGEETDSVHRITPAEFEKEVAENHHPVIDIRREGEYEAEHLVEAVSKPLAYINDWISTLDADKHFYMHCASGYRSMIAASILQARGYRNFTEVEGGYNAIAKTSLPKTAFTCQSQQ